MKNNKQTDQANSQETTSQSKRKLLASIGLFTGVALIGAAPVLLPAHADGASARQRERERLVRQRERARLARQRERARNN